MRHEDLVLDDKERRQLVHFSGITDLVTEHNERMQAGDWHPYQDGVYEKKQWAHGSLKNVKNTERCLLLGEPPQHVIDKAKAFQEALMASDAYRTASERAQSTKRRRVFELDGGELDIDRYMGQQDECWVRVTRGLQRPVLRLAVNVSASSGNDESTFAGVAALGTCCALLAEQSGCSLEIMCAMTSHQTKAGCYETAMVFPVKQAEEPFHQDSLLSLGVPGLFRWYGFNIVDNAMTGETHYGQGFPRGATPALRTHLNVQHVLEVAWDNGRQQMFLDEFVKTLHDA